MASPVIQSRVGAEVVPPLFAGLLCDDLAAAKLAERKIHCEAALIEASNALSEDRLVSSLAKFREALSLARGHATLETQVREASITAAGRYSATNWRFAESLLHELVSGAGVPAPVLDTIAQKRRAEAVRIALDECGRAEESEHLPHLRDRLAALAKTYPDEESLTTRLNALDTVLAQRPEEERGKNLSRVLLFRHRLDGTDRPETLRRFSELVAPFTARYPDDPAFTGVLAEMRALWTQYEETAKLVRDGHSKKALQICDAVLQIRPANVLFAGLEEKAKSREWVARLVAAGSQRAQTFEQKGQYAAALDEWEALREIDPKYPGLASEILHCAALKQQTEAIHSPEPPPEALVHDDVLTPQIVASEPAEQEPVPMLLAPTTGQTSPAWPRIAITEGAWNHLKTGLVAAFAVLLVLLVLASNARK